MLIGINILSKKSFTINTKNKKATIESCDNIIIPLKVTPQAHTQFTQQILADKDTTLPAKTLGQIFIKSNLPEEKDPLLKLSYTKPNVTVFAQIIDCRMTKILMQNNIDNAVTIASRTQLEQVVEYN